MLNRFIIVGRMDPIVVSFVLRSLVRLYGITTSSELARRNWLRHLTARWYGLSRWGSGDSSAMDGASEDWLNVWRGSEGWHSASLGAARCQVGVSDMEKRTTTASRRWTDCDVTNDGDDGTVRRRKVRMGRAHR